MRSGMKLLRLYTASYCIRGGRSPVLPALSSAAADNAAADNADAVAFCSRGGHALLVLIELSLHFLPLPFLLIQLRLQLRNLGLCGL